ncbi:Uma2 family endonuclease [Thermoleptolyngbya sichuanensis A183]|uniref:Uma2 family endonuclease n=1 Tax=Thermoleptolyngbya sichuanensis A183 TaxID=2737172 RepID=A0A6M8B4S7_9CYAN|nr:MULTISPECIES: Uma2 family endonuclease [Thermoleptolyngbya]QKD81924.1 Uma2 family endonuclease [Thermoleptolyngbya sichuanensis A183]
MIVAATKPLQTPQPVRFTVQDYHRLVELGLLGEDDHIELIRGELIQMAARGTAHETCITRLLRVLPELVGDRATLRCQSPITLSFDGEPEPDFSIVQNREDDYESAHPTPAETLLVMEVADSSLEYDRTVKLSLYAEAGIRDYWLFNVVDRYLEAYSQPAEVAPGQFGYLHRQIVTAQAAIALPPFPEQVLSLDCIFP